MKPPLKLHSRWTAYLFCLGSALLLIGVFPKMDLSALVWIALVPWLWAMDQKPARVFRLGYLTGLIFFIGTLYWIKYVTWAGMICLCAYLALYFGLFGWGYRYFSRLSVARKILVYSCLWVVLEYIRSTFLTGFGWAVLGHSQSNNLALIQVVDVVGVYGISFLIVAVNVLIKENLVFVCSQHQSSAGEGQNSSNIRRLLLRCNIIVLLGLVAVYGYGYYRLKESSGFDYFRVGVVQGNIPQEEKWIENNREATIAKYLRLSQAILPDRPDVIFWPETAFPGMIEEMPELMEQIREFVRVSTTPLMIGVVTQIGERYYNSALLLTPDGGTEQRYDKYHLVPFGEFIPLRRQFPFLADLIPIEDFSSGQKATVFKWTQDNRTVLFSVAVCFEDTLSYITRKFVHRGAQLLVNMTNDAWFGDTKEPFMHLQAAVFRTIENRRAMVRVANTGVSGLIDPYGRIIRFIQNADGKKTYIDGAAVFRAPLHSATTFYTKWGEVFTYLCFVCILWQSFELMVQSRNRRRGL